MGDMNDLQSTAVRIYLRTLEALDPFKAVVSALRLEGDGLTIGSHSFDLRSYRRLVVAGLGKASVRMVAGVEAVLGSRLEPGILVTDRRHDDVPTESEVLLGGHPVPNRQSEVAARRLAALVGSCGKGDLVLFALSGGGSALAETPILDQVSLEDIALLNLSLVKCGANIENINIIRKHLSAIKGGRLGNLAGAAEIIVILLSDVNPGDIRSIASNPLLPDDTSLGDFYRVIDEIAVSASIPASIRSAVDQRRIAALPSGQPAGRRVAVTLMDNLTAIETAARFARESGFFVVVEPSLQEGDYRDIAGRSITQLLEAVSRDGERRVAFISGGEVSCPVIGSGTGGRNQEFVLYSAAQLAAADTDLQTAVLSCGTDGIDGNSPAAGAVAGPGAVRRARELGADLESFFRNNDSHRFFRDFGGLVVTGPTGNNVRDLRLALAAT